MLVIADEPIHAQLRLFWVLVITNDPSVNLIARRSRARARPR